MLAEHDCSLCHKPIDLYQEPYVKVRDIYGAIRHYHNDPRRAERNCWFNYNQWQLKQEKQHH